MPRDMICDTPVCDYILPTAQTSVSRHLLVTHVCHSEVVEKPSHSTPNEIQCLQLFDFHSNTLLTDSFLA
eukprot:scaffold2365_cov77-Skeletonema_dohrnii-CCMP3373.AAC.25